MISRRKLFSFLAPIVALALAPATAFARRRCVCAPVNPPTFYIPECWKDVDPPFPPIPADPIPNPNPIPQPPQPQPGPLKTVWGFTATGQARVSGFGPFRVEIQGLFLAGGLFSNEDAIKEVQFFARGHNAALESIDSLSVGPPLARGFRILA